jgi:glutamate racemase
VIPLAEAAVAATRYGRIGVIGTRATIESKVYEQELNKLRSNLRIFGQPCPLLVPLVEEGWGGKPETNMILKKYLRPLKTNKIDTLLLGCTHYPFLRGDIMRIMGKNCQVLDAPGIVAEKLVAYLGHHPEIDQRLPKGGKRMYFTTDDAERFMSLGGRFLGQHIQGVERVVLG